LPVTSTPSRLARPITDKETLGEFARRKKEFDDRDTKIIGVSVDSVASHRDWSADIAETQGHALNFPLVGDAERFPKGFTTLKPYLRLAPQPNR
jgi:AhpC/TSA family